MTKMTSRLCRSRPINVSTEKLSNELHHNVQKNDKFNPNRAEIANMVERSSLPTMLKTKATLYKAEMPVSFPFLCLDWKSAVR